MSDVFCQKKLHILSIIFHSYNELCILYLSIKINLRSHQMICGVVHISDFLGPCCSRRLYHFRAAKSCKYASCDWTTQQSYIKLELDIIPIMNNNLFWQKEMYTCKCVRHVHHHEINLKERAALSCMYKNVIECPMSLLGSLLHHRILPFYLNSTTFTKS